MQHFHTDYDYVDRATKSTYVWRKYQPILTGRTILDVGAGESYLKEQVDATTQYWSIGLGGNIDQQVDLEKELLPFPDRSFDVLLCLDVLEHVENIYALFDDLCRVARRHVIIALPNPWADFYGMLRHGEYRPGKPMKYYGLPNENPGDRHKWFFSAVEAEEFIRHRSRLNHMRVLQLDDTGIGAKPGGWRPIVRRALNSLLGAPILSSRHFTVGTLWAVLERPGDK